MSFVAIPIRTEADPVNVSWWNALRTAGIAIENNVLPATAFTVANNQVAAANVTSMTIDSAEYTSAKIKIELKRSDATPTSVMAIIYLHVYYKGSTWYLIQEDTSLDDCGVVFSITTSVGVGQVQYTSTDLAGGSYSGSMKWSMIERFAA